ncbi:hypothetical protein PC121_g9180 [Phytophthora cactorum]|nr:hypothetical protein PC121_g9180 [Phytophthora cactorum]
MAEVSENTVSNWYAACHVLRSKKLLNSEFKIGGEGHIIEINKTKIEEEIRVRARKAQQGVLIVQWRGLDYKAVVRAHRIRQTHESDAAPFIKNTRIHSDKFATYVAKRGSRVDTLANNRMFADMHYEHSWENHTLNFVDPLTGTHANTIEGLWEMQIKRHIKAMRGMSKDYLDGYIDEYMWRSWFCSVRASPGEYMCVLVQTVIRYPKDDK